MSPLTHVHCDTNLCLCGIVQYGAGNLGRCTKFNHAIVMALSITTGHKPFVVNRSNSFRIQILHFWIKFNTAFEIDICNLFSKLILGIITVSCALLGVACNTVAHLFMGNATIIDKTHRDIVVLNYSLMPAFNNSRYK